MTWPQPGVDRCPRLVYRWPGRRLDPLLALAARMRRRAYGAPHQCGLLWAHAGRCVWFTPGEYLVNLAPLLHPLDPRGRHEPCPDCGCRVSSMEGDGPYWVVRDEHMTVMYSGPVPGSVREVVWRFGPCGCRRREVLAQAASDPSSPASSSA